VIPARRDARIAGLLRREMGVEARAVAPLVGGQVGHVFRVDTDGGAFVVKFVGARREGAYAEEPRDDRVYGSRWSNLQPAYELLRKSGVAAPRLHASGTLADEGLHFAILDFVDGDADDFSAAWFSGLGAALGALHAITRPFQGWVAMDGPYPEPWVAAFPASFRSVLAQAAPIVGERLARVVEARAQDDLAAFTEPGRFVFSHTDGFQGLFRQTGGGWALAGVIDIEDHQFTDPRFVLAGLELQHAWAGRTIPAEFWAAYGPAEPGWDRNKTLFQLYYLLVWARVLRDQAEAFGTCVRMLERLAR
jgi:fructosamine-3-kinase